MATTTLVKLNAASSNRIGQHSFTHRTAAVPFRRVSPTVVRASSCTDELVKTHRQWPCAHSGARNPS